MAKITSLMFFPSLFGSKSKKMSVKEMIKRPYIEFLNKQITAKYENSDLPELLKRDDYETASVSRNDSFFIYDYVLKNKPKKVVEFGTGKTTWIIAHAMSSYFKPNGEYKLVSLEDVSFWFEEQKKNFPYSKIPAAKDFVELKLSPTEYYEYRWARGTSYQETPREHFDLCLVDGPNQEEAFNADLVKVVESCESSVDIIIDGRTNTVVAAMSLLGTEKMTRLHIGLCIFKGVTRDDLIKSPKLKTYVMSRKVHKYYRP